MIDTRTEEYQAEFKETEVAVKRALLALRMWRKVWRAALEETNRRRQLTDQEWANLFYLRHGRFPCVIVPVVGD